MAQIIFADETGDAVAVDGARNRHCKKTHVNSLQKKVILLTSETLDFLIAGKARWTRTLLHVIVDSAFRVHSTSGA